MYGMKKGGKKDKAGGCMGEKHSFASHSGVAIGQQKMVNFMSDGAMKAPKLNNDKMHSFMPGGEVKKQ
jgi:hypothetical protein